MEESRREATSSKSRMASLVEILQAVIGSALHHGSRPRRLEPAQEVQWLAKLLMEVVGNSDFLSASALIQMAH